MEPAIGRIIVFSPTIGTHPEFCHSGLRSVIGDIADNRVARTAVCAIGKGILKTSVTRSLDLREAIPAGSDIRRNECEVSSLGTTFENGKFFVATRFKVLNRYFLNFGKRRQVFLKLFPKFIKGFGL
jgi:hypothetical protein